MEKKGALLYNELLQPFFNSLWKSMDDRFKIYVEQLREGHEEKIHEKLQPDFLELGDPELIFDQPVELDGVAYLAERELIMRWEIKTEAKMPCAICNEPVTVPIHLMNFYTSEPLAEIKTGVYNFKDLLRETILLEVPSFVECKGECPKRKEFKKYMKEPSNLPVDQEEGYQPFADLDWKP